MHTEKAMAPHSSTLAWKIPWMEEPGGLPSMGSQRVGHDWATSLSLFTFVHWRRRWQPTPVFLPGEFQGMGEPGGLPSVGSHRVGHDWSDLAAAAAVEQAGGVPGPDFISSGPGVSNRKWQAISASNHKAQCDFRKAIAEGHTVWICSFFVFSVSAYTWHLQSLHMREAFCGVSRCHCPRVNLFLHLCSSSSAAYSLSPSPHQF